MCFRCSRHLSSSLLFTRKKWSIIQSLGREEILLFTLSSTHFYCIYIVNLHITYLLDLGCINSFREHFTLISFKIVRTFTVVFENECFCNTSPFNHNIFNSFAKFGTFPILHNFRKRRIYWGSSCEVREVTNSRKEIVRTWPLRFVGMMIMMI